MSTLTLLEASKQIIEEEKRAYIQTYAESSHVLTKLPVSSIIGDHIKWSQEETLGGTGSRAVNADYTASNGTSKPYVSPLKIYGGSISIDRFVAETNPNAVANMRKNKVASLARKLTVDFFEGQGGNDLKGLRQWAKDTYTNQNIRCGATSGGNNLTMPILDDVLDHVNIIAGQTFIYCNQKIANAITALGRANNQIIYSVNEQGIRVPYYNNIEVVVLKDGNGDPILSEVEDGQSTSDLFSTGTATSLYVVTFGEDMVTGFQSPSGMLVKSVQDATNFETTIMEWNVGTAPKHKRSFARLFNVKNTALLS